MTDKHITRPGLHAMVRDMLDRGYIVMSDSPDGTGYRAVKNGDQVALDPARRPANMSWKDVVFPKTEPVLHYIRLSNDVELHETQPPQSPTVILGAKPCDARSVQILDKLFNWDYHDEYFNSRAQNTVVIGMMCGAADEFCFCTSVGSGPASESGSDLFLVPLADDSFALRVVTEKGAALLATFEDHCDTTAPQGVDAALSGAAVPTRGFDRDAVRAWLTANFESDYWNKPGDLCLGCGQCAFACPVCHCFDLIDEMDSYTDGRRMKNWDGCQFGIFTLHASGHNPRDTQGHRYRQRMQHKFRIYPERFGETLCTGCGRCSRGCAVGIDIAELATDIAGFARV
jgi:sulfhydrogenase subunit beta (sulfur reductase)